MIDLHTHVLSGIDDGPEDTVGSMAMAHVAARRGTRTLVATPHVRDDHPKVLPGEIRQRARVLNRLVREYGIDLFIVPGAEVALGNAVAMTDEELREVTLGGNGRDLLVETPYGAVPSVFESLIDSVVERGFRVTLAHPELSPTFQRDPERLGRIADSGVLLQITAGSLTHRSAARRLAVKALDRGWATVLASDAHSVEWRPPDLGPGLEAARRQISGIDAQLDWMVNAAPLAIIQGRDLPPRPQRTARRESLWRRLRW